MRGEGRKFFAAFLALKPKAIKETVILSPIIYPKQFEKITGQTGKHYKSMLGYLIANFRDQTFIKTPMTHAAVSDLVVLLKETKCKKIIFIGAIGGLQKGLRIGDIVVSRKARDVYSVKSIHEETRKKLISLRKKGIIGIDLESRVFFSAAKRAKLFAAAHYVVTDLPLSKPFYIGKTIKEEERIKESVSKIIRGSVP